MTPHRACMHDTRSRIHHCACEHESLSEVPWPKESFTVRYPGTDLKPLLPSDYHYQLYHSVYTQLIIHMIYNVDI